MERPWMNPLCPSAVNGPGAGSTAKRHALARSLLSVFVTFKGQTPSGSKRHRRAPSPLWLSSGGNKMPALKSGHSVASPSEASTSQNSKRAPCNMSTARFSTRRQAAYGIPSGPGAKLLDVLIAVLMCHF
eukprot:3454295-Pyramimonas_sp.AAC.1